MRRILGPAVALLLVTTTACAAVLPDRDAVTSSEGSGGAASTSGPTVPVSDTTGESPRFVPEQLADLEIRQITIVDGDTQWGLMVAVADVDAARVRGLMNVTDLGDLDGMLFAWEEPTASGFWMSDVILPLDIAFFGTDLTLVDSYTMPLCTTDDCPTYYGKGPHQYAVEVPASTFWGITSAATLILDS
jgi:uncharacterized membrane protein (UPF0127 family)